MIDYQLTATHIAAFGQYLRQEERAAATIEKYLRDVEKFVSWLDGRPVTKEASLN